MKISDVLNDLKYDRLVNGFSDKTIERYDQFIGYFIDFNGDLEVSKISQSHIDDYKFYLLNKVKNDNNNYKPTGGKLSRSTINSYLKEVFVLINFCKKNNYPIDRDLKTQFVKEPKKVIEILNEKEITTLVCLPEKTFNDVRNKLMIMLMLDSGLRVQEVINATLESVDQEYLIFKVIESKGMKDRNVPISQTVLNLYNKYIGLRPHTINNYLFINRSHEQITYDAVTSMMFRLKKSLNIRKFNPHFLRHTFATRFIIEQLLDTGQADVFTLKEILGHESIDTTMIYLHTAKMYLYTGHKYSPIERILDRNDQNPIMGIGRSKTNIIDFKTHKKSL